MPLVLDGADGLDLSRWIRPGDGLVWGQACAEPVALTAALTRQAPALGPLTAFVGTTYADAFDPAAAPGIRLRSYGASGRNRAWHAAGLLEVLPVHYSALADLLRRRVIPADVVLLTLVPPGPDGRYPLALADEYLSTAVDCARVVIAEVSPAFPSILGARTLGPDEIDVVVRTDRAPVTWTPPEPDGTDRALARQVAALVPDGAVLQIGIGSFPGAVLAALGEHNDLGIHSGLFADGMVDLVERGVVTNRTKPIDRGVSVGGVVMGGARLIEWLDGNPHVALRDTAHTHDVAVLGSLPRFTAVNTALEVDLTGQVGAEAVGGRHVGGIGGALDFTRGAHRSDGGLPIVALPASGRGRSRIVERLSGPVTIGQADVGVVVTQFGDADLRGLGPAARREALLAISDPDCPPVEG
ncbi:acetyl-CoA hydrolase/transferase family protein [Geodermatophilus sp. URMC 64]